MEQKCSLFLACAAVHRRTNYCFQITQLTISNGMKYTQYRQFLRKPKLIRISEVHNDPY